MGAIFESCFMNGKTKQEVRKEFEEMQDDARLESGESYSGGWNMTTGLEFTEEEFQTPEQADSWLEENTNKWDVAKVVKVNGKWYVGAWLAM